jgi:hypothetical protein
VFCKLQENALVALESAGLFRTGGLVKEKVMGLHQILLFITLIHLFLFSLSVLLPNYNVYFSIAVNHVMFMDDLFFWGYSPKNHCLVG